MSKVTCEWCDRLVDTSVDIDWEHLYRLLVANLPNDDRVVCHPCVDRCCLPDEAELVGFLITEGYDSLWEWAWDSNYALFADGMWRDDSGSMVDVVGMAFAAMEVSQ